MTRIKFPSFSKMNYQYVAALTGNLFIPQNNLKFNFKKTWSNLCSWPYNGGVWLRFGMVVHGTSAASIRQKSIGNGQNFGYWYVLDWIRHIVGCNIWKLFFRTHCNDIRNEAHNFHDWISSIGELYIHGRMIQQFIELCFNFQMFPGELAILDVRNESAAFNYFTLFERYCCWRYSNLYISVSGWNSR